MDPRRFAWDEGDVTIEGPEDSPAPAKKRLGWLGSALKARGVPTNPATDRRYKANKGKPPLTGQAQGAAAAQGAAPPHVAGAGRTSAPSAAVPTDAAYWSKATSVGGQKGSNPGGVMQGPDGQKYYVKRYSNPEQAHTEVAGQKVYQSLGLEAPTGAVVSIGGKPALANKWVEGNQQLDGKGLNAELRKDPATAGKLFAAAAVTQNWDHVGTGYDNLVRRKDGKMMVVDTGGSFTFRAQGGHKPYTTDAKEVKSLLDPKISSYSAKAFEGLDKSPQFRTAARDAALQLARSGHSAPGVSNSQFRAKAQAVADAMS